MIDKVIETSKELCMISEGVAFVMIKGSVTVNLFHQSQFKDIENQQAYTAHTISKSSRRELRKFITQYFKDLKFFNGHD